MAVFFSCPLFLAAGAPVELASVHDFEADLGATHSARFSVAFVDPVSICLARALGKQLVSSDHE